MNARALACALVLALSGCDGCGSEPATPDGGTRQTAAPAPTPETEALTPAGRAAAHARAVTEDRERASRRATLLGDGRRHGRAGRHAEALRSFEDALGDAGGPDAALHCEAGFQAIQLGQWALARRHLNAGLSVAVQPRRRAACLYDLALVDEAEQDRAAAIEALRESLSLRPNGTVERKLRALEAEAAQAESTTEEPASVEEATAAHATLDELCPEQSCQRDEVTIPTRPDDWPEVAFVTHEAPDEPMLETWLVAKYDAGWSDVRQVASSDVRDLYGALEAAEEVAEVRFEENRMVVSVVGGFDEHEDEAERYFECEREHQTDHGAVMECFEAATEGLPPPESWTFELVFELADGELVLSERRAGSASQTPRE